MPKDMWKPAGLPPPNPKPEKGLEVVGSLRWPAGRGGTFSLQSKHQLILFLPGHKLWLNSAFYLGSLASELPRP